MSKVKTRIAPSPTGPLHVGTARSALFSYLFAKKYGGEFVIRIEDTDKERSTKEFEEDILESFEWLGLGHDGKIERQSERGELYKKAIEKLLVDDKAYQIEGEAAIELRVEPQEVVFTDLVRGEVKVHSDAWGGDFVIARSIDDPLYHLAVIVDDADMEISHVIRGEDHLTNTARHILLQRALELPVPEYAHLPLLLDQQKRKLSKRSLAADSATSDVTVAAFKEAGFLPEALVNYLALLGWNPGDDREIFSLDELVKEFSLEKVQKGGAIFSEEKLVSVNKEYIRKLSAEELLEKTLKGSGAFIDINAADPFGREYWIKAIATEQERVGTLAELPEAIDFFRPDWEADYDADMLVWRKSDKEKTREYLEALRDKIGEIPEDKFNEKDLEEILMTWIDDEKQWGRGDVLWPLRVALTGREKSPGPFEVGGVLGKGEVLRRVGFGVDKV